VIKAIFGENGDGSSSYPVGSGSWATFWYGHSYTTNDTRYFSGFAYQSPAHPPGTEEVDDPPSAKATLTQATFRLENSRWAKVVTQRDLGDLGARGRADSVDAKRSVQSYTVAPNQFVLAVPTDAQIEQGVVQKNYEILRHEPDGHWNYFGTIEAGTDDSAGCDGGRVFPCNAVSGKIAFVAAEGMPEIRVTLDHGGNAPEILTYRFSTEESSYQITH